jgi:hypothetical protein
MNCSNDFLHCMARHTATGATAATARQASTLRDTRRHASTRGDRHRRSATGRVAGPLRPRRQASTLRDWCDSPRRTRRDVACFIGCCSRDGCGVLHRGQHDVACLIGCCSRDGCGMPHRVRQVQHAASGAALAQRQIMLQHFFTPRATNAATLQRRENLEQSTLRRAVERCSAACCGIPPHMCVFSTNHSVVDGSVQV